MKKFMWLVSIFIVFSMMSSTAFANSNSRKKNSQIKTQKQLQKMIQKEGVKKPVLNALKAGILSGKEISSGAFKSKKAKPVSTARILAEMGIPKMAIISAAVKAGLNAHVIAKGIKAGIKKRHWHPIHGNPGGNHCRNPISKVNPWLKCCTQHRNRPYCRKHRKGSRI